LFNINEIHFSVFWNWPFILSPDVPEDELERGKNPTVFLFFSVLWVVFANLLSANDFESTVLNSYSAGSVKKGKNRGHGGAPQAQTQAQAIIRDPI
jgi:hypothetical protein